MIHEQLADENLNEKELIIKRGIDMGLFVVDSEKESADINNTKEEEIRIILCFVLEELEKNNIQL
jgi:hypothetical protein